MPLQPEYYSRSPETLLVNLARKGDRNAFAQLVRARQAWIRTLMLRCCNDAALADDLAQQAFMQAWRTLPQLRQSNRFAAWLKRLAINIWLQHVRKRDPLEQADSNIEIPEARNNAPALELDLDRALATLKDHVRLCIVLSYHEGMTHDEIAELTGMPLGTIKSHVRRGTQRLQEILAAYKDTSLEEKSL